MRTYTERELHRYYSMILISTPKLLRYSQDLKLSMDFAPHKRRNVTIFPNKKLILK